MQMKDTGLGFGLVTIVSHWTGAILMLGFVAMSFSTLGLEGTQLLARYETAASVGFLCFCLFSFRIYWRLKHHHPLPLGGATPIEVLVGRGVAFGLLLAGVILPLIFWAYLSARGVDVKVFTISFPALWQPGPTAALSLSVLFWLGITAFTLGFLLHLFGAIKHQFITKDDAMLRLMGKKIEL